MVSQHVRTRSLTHCMMLVQDSQQIFGDTMVKTYSYYRTAPARLGYDPLSTGECEGRLQLYL